MAMCISFVATRDKFLKYSFSHAGLKSTTNDLGDGTINHTWVPKTPDPAKPNLLLIHGLGANTMWQWHNFISPLLSKFNLYVPDLVFFGNSHTTRPDRSESFQAQCLMKTMEILGICKMNVVGLSYGGYVGYSMAAQFPEAVEKMVVVSSGIAVEPSDFEKGMFTMKSMEEAVEVFLGQTPDKMRELLRISFVKPPKFLPSFFLTDYINVSLSNCYVYCL